MSENDINIYIRKLEREISARKQAEALLEEKSLALYQEALQRDTTLSELKESEERYRLLIESSPNAIFVACNNTVVFSNRVATGIFKDHTAKNFIETKILTVAGSGNPIFKSSEYEVSEEVVPFENGADKLYELTRLITNYKGMPALQIVMRDITLRRQAELERRDLEVERLKNQELEKSTQSKSNFLANMSHEIRTPMNAIIGFSYLGIKEKDVDKLNDYLGKIHTASTNLLGIIDDILDFSKIEAGKLEIDTVELNLRTLTTEVNHYFEAIVGLKGLKLDFLIDDAIPESLLGDPLRIRQVLANLVSNAIKFSTVGTIKVSLDLEAKNDDTVTIVFSVQDRGIGISEDQLKKLFQAFMQADVSTTRKFGGTGLGLVITQKLVNLMGGSMNVESRLGVGSRFYFSLPLRIAKDISPDLPDTDVENTYPQIQDMRVLLVEDNKLNQLLVQALLKKVSVEVVLANNGQEAISVLKSGENFDLILMDLQMPKMDGVEATINLRNLQNYSDIPVIAVTASATVEEKKRCLDAGMNGIITKPINAEVLYKVLERYSKN